MTKKVCEKCGKEFEARGEWQKICLDCYKAGGSSTKATSTTKTPVKSSSKSTGTTGKEAVSAEMFRKAYDELVAEFSDIHDEVKDYLGGWTSTIVINRSK